MIAPGKLENFPAAPELPYKAAEALLVHPLVNAARVVLRIGLEYAPTERIKEQLADLELAISPRS